MPPTFSIITPSLNQARFLPRCLGSVADQQYRPLEHFVFDPGSTDDSRAIAEVATAVTLVAEPDTGQCNAINKGIARARGEVFAWLNSDDFYPSDDVLASVAARFNASDQPDVVYGRAEFVDEVEKPLRDAYINNDPDSLRRTLAHQVGIIQPAVFIRRRVFERIGGLDETFHYALDYEYWARIVCAGFRWGFIDKVLARHRWWPAMKTASRRDLSLHEHCRVGIKHFGYVHWLWIHRLADCLIGGVDGIIGRDTSRIDPLERARKIASLYLEYNGTDDVRHRLLSAHQDPLIRHTIADMLNHGVPIRVPATTAWSPAAYSGKLPRSWRAQPGHSRQGAPVTGYSFSERLNCAFDQTWCDDQLARSANHIDSLRAARTSDTCVIVGNGPSLQKTRLADLDLCDVIISNFAYYHHELKLKATYLTIVNDYVMRQAAYDLPQLRSVCKFFPIWLSPYTIPQPEAYFLNALLTPEFSHDIASWISWRSTVSFFNLQLAAGLGYRKILLVGFDHSYSQAPGVKEGDLIEQESDDENHFIANYFKGKVWQAADTDNMAKVYQIARDAAKDRGIDIVNCTVGGMLEVFRRSTISAELV